METVANIFLKSDTGFEINEISQVPIIFNYNQYNYYLSLLNFSFLNCSPNIYNPASSALNEHEYYLNYNLTTGSDEPVFKENLIPAGLYDTDDIINLMNSYYEFTYVNEQDPNDPLNGTKHQVVTFRIDKFTEKLVITYNAAEASLRAKIEAKTVFDCAHKNDETALAVYREFISNLAQAIGSVVNLIDPEVIVLGGGVSKAGHYLLDPPVLGSVINLFRKFSPIRCTMNSPGTYLTATCDDERLQIEQTILQIGAVESDSSFIADLILNADADIISGTSFHLDLTLQTGTYTTTLSYLLTVGRAIETFESGDFSFLDWFYDGDLPWTVTDEEAHSGNYCARSGAIGDDEVTKLIMYADILADGEISFWFKTSTESRKDIFAFYIDNRKQDWWWGENDWTYTSYELTAGSHAFIWLYDKNRNGSAGEDCAWVDDITFPRSCLITGVEEVTEQKATALYPNPTTGHFTIELTEESNVGIYNMLGQQVMQLNKVSGDQQIQLENAPKGMYFVQIQSGNKIEVKKLIIE